MPQHTSPLFTGCATALVTPFQNGNLDETAYLRILHRQLEAGIDALVVAGTTGESPTLTDAEKKWLFTTAVKEAHACGLSTPPKIIAGTGSNNTRRAVELSRIAEDCGCDGLLVVTPYYNKASEDGLIAHYEAIAEAIPLPLIAYHVPARTGCKMPPSACRRLAALPNVVGLKDATGDLSFTARVASLCGDSLPLYSGNDDQTLPILSLGGRGVISVVSNLCPEAMTRLCRLWREGKTAEAKDLQLSLIPLCDALFCEVNPIPVKAGMELLGLCSDEVRLPLARADERVRARVAEALRGIGMLS
jgi:4-hydroxy-tetrahydrodipicolinate synthase